MIGCVILTQGDRRELLVRAIDSVRSQDNVEVEVLVVINGTDDVVTPPAVDRLVMGHNTGVPVARNRGLAKVDGDLILFLDDDAELGAPDVLAQAEQRFAHRPGLGILSLRLLDPSGRAPQRRHVPRLRAGDPARSSPVTTFLGGACIVRRAVFDEVGDYPEEFFWAHEETSLAWRAIDAGYEIRYEGDLIVHHPSLPPSGTQKASYHDSRNRVLLARRHLPLPVGLLYVANWTLLAMVRTPGRWRSILRGISQGLQQPTGPRRPISWRACWRMTRAGRPPII